MPVLFYIFMRYNISFTIWNWVYGCLLHYSHLPKIQGQFDYPMYIVICEKMIRIYFSPHFSSRIILHCSLLLCIQLKQFTLSCKPTPILTYPLPPQNFTSAHPNPQPPTLHPNKPPNPPTPPLQDCSHQILPPKKQTKPNAKSARFRRHQAVLSRFWRAMTSLPAWTGVTSTLTARDSCQRHISACVGWKGSCWRWLLTRTRRCGGGVRHWKSKWGEVGKTL